MDGRRSIRKSAVLPVMLSGTDFSGLAFKENTWTIAVNQHGAKISTSYRLAVGDQIIVGNHLLGHLAKARVIRVAAKGRAFEIGVELLEPKDVWGGKTPLEDWETGRTSGENDEAVAKADYASPSPDQQHTPPAQLETAKGSEDGAALVGQSPREHEKPSSFDPSSESAGDFLRASRTELHVLLAKAQEIQKISLQAVQALLEEVQVGLHQQLEVAADSFVNDTSRRIQNTASVALQVFSQEASARQTALMDAALARAQTLRQDIELSLKKGVEECQKQLADSSAIAIQKFQLEGNSFYESFRIELHKTFDDLKKKAAEDISERLRDTAGQLADELRRRADVDFEILNEQLTKSAQALGEERQKQLAGVSQSALAALTKEAADAVGQQVGLGVTALKETAEQTRVSLATSFEHSVAAFQNQLGELTTVALERNSKTSEFLLHDLQSRLDQAARALRHTVSEASRAD